MSGHISTYDAKKVTTVVGGRIITGFPDGSMVKASKTNNNFDSSSGAQGDVAVAINGDRLGMVVITLLPTSPSIPYLDQLANDNIMTSVWINSANALKETTGGSKAMIQKIADVEYGKGISNREYTLEVFDYQKK